MPRTDVDAAPTVLERDDLLRDLAADLQRARQGEGRFVALAAPAGGGKSTVVRALAARSSSSGPVLIGACDGLFTPRPLGPVHDLSGASPSIRALLEQAGDRTRLFAGLLAELVTSPALLVVEDAHWADEATLDLLRYLGRRADQTRSLIVATYRDDEVDAHHPLRLVLGDLATAPACRRLELPPLTVDAVRAMTAGHAVDPEHLHHITGGNPFYVSEVLAAPEWTVPPTVTDAVLARLARQEPAVRTCLEVASVEPGAVEPWLLERLGVNGAHVDDALGSGLLRPVGDRVTFRHELARRAVHGSVVPQRRRHLHGRALAALVDAGVGDAARLAHHAVAAGDVAAVLRWADEAGRSAASAGAHRQAADLLLAAVAYVDHLDVADAADLLSRCAAELAMIGRAVEALPMRQRVVELRREVGDAAEVAAAYADLALASWSAGQGDRARAAVETALAMLAEPGADGGRMRVYDVAAALAMLNRRGEDAVRFCEAALDAADPADRAAQAGILNWLGSALLVCFEDLDGTRHLERSAAIAQEAGDQRLRAAALLNLGSGLGEIRRYDEARDALETAAALATEHDLDRHADYATAWLARVHAEQGRWAEGEALAAAVVGGPVPPPPPTAIVALTVLGQLRARRGAPGAADHLDQAWALAAPTRDLQRLWPVVAARAETAWLGLRSDAGLEEDLRATRALAASLGSAWAVGELTAWLARLGLDPGPAPTTAPAEPYALELAGDRRGAARAWRLRGCAYDEATVLASGDEDDLRGALALLMDLGAGPLADRLRRDLRAGGASAVPTGPRPGTAAHPDGLTPRQAEVFDLVAEGLGNSEIAERLVLSQKTVEHHVSAVLRKLGARTRAEAIATRRRSDSGH